MMSLSSKYYRYSFNFFSSFWFDFFFFILPPTSISHLEHSFGTLPYAAYTPDFVFVFSAFMGLTSKLSSFLIMTVWWTMFLRRQATTLTRCWLSTLNIHVVNDVIANKSANVLNNSNYAANLKLYCNNAISVACILLY